MEEAAERRHRRRVIALAVFAGVCAALGTGWVIYWERPRVFYTLELPIRTYEWHPVMPRIYFADESRVLEKMWSNLWKVAVPGALIVGLFVGVAGYVVESMNSPGRRIHWVLVGILWLVIWVTASLVGQFAISHFQDLAQEMLVREWNSSRWQHIGTTGLKHGRNAAFLWVFPYLLFRRLDDSDWVPTRRFWIPLSLVVIISVTGAFSFAQRVADERPQGMIHRLSPGRGVTWVTKEQWEAGLPAVAASAEAGLRASNASRIAPIAGMMGGLTLFVTGILIGVPSRAFRLMTVLRLCAWTLALALAGAVSQWAAVYWRESYWIYFAPIGADRTEHILARMAEGAEAAVEAWLVWLALTLAGVGIVIRWLPPRLSDPRQTEKS